MHGRPGARVQEGERMEIFRGKDFFRYFRERPEELDGILAELGLKDAAARDTEQKIHALGKVFMQRGYFVRSERFFPRPHPYRQTLVKWPIRVSPMDDQSFAELTWYTWLHQRPPTPWVSIMSWIVALIVIAICLFPLAPHWVKLVVFYSSLSLLAFIAVLCVVRLILYGALWTAVGRHMWLFPNLFSDTVPIEQIFSPIFEEDVDYRTGKPFPAPLWYNRLVSVAAAGGAMYVVYSIAPEEGYGVKMKSQHDDLLEFFGIEDNLSIKGNATAEAAAANATAANATAANATAIVTAANATANATGGPEGGGGKSEL